MADGPGLAFSRKVEVERVDQLSSRRFIYGGYRRQERMTGSMNGSGRAAVHILIPI
jgi:hypothetical protein